MNPLGDVAAGLVHGLNENAGAVQAVATVVLVVVTIWYARKTSELAEQARRQTKVVEDEASSGRAQASEAVAEIASRLLRIVTRLSGRPAPEDRTALLEARDRGDWTELRIRGERASPEIRKEAKKAIDALDDWSIIARPPRGKTGLFSEEMGGAEAAKGKAKLAAEALERCIDLARKNRG